MSRRKNLRKKKAEEAMAKGESNFITTVVIITVVLVILSYLVYSRM